MTITVSSALLDALVLSVVRNGDTYGYRITQDVRTAMDLSESTLYPVLRRLQKDACLRAYDQEYLGRNRRYYTITDKGRYTLGLLLAEWKLYKERIDNVFERGVAE